MNKRFSTYIEKTGCIALTGGHLSLAVLLLLATSYTLPLGLGRLVTATSLLPNYRLPLNTKYSSVVSCYCVDYTTMLGLLTHDIQHSLFYLSWSKALGEVMRLKIQN